MVTYVATLYLINIINTKLTYLPVSLNRTHSKLIDVVEEAMEMFLSFSKLVPNGFGDFKFGRQKNISAIVLTSLIP